MFLSSASGGRGPQGFTGPTGPQGFTPNPTEDSSAVFYTGYSGPTGGVFYQPGTGLFFNSNKPFIIDHPKDKEKYLVHVCLEGPEAGVYYRGTGAIINNDSVEIELPNYVDELATTFTINVTPICSNSISIRNLGVSKVMNNKFTVFGKNSEFFWVVYGKRDDILIEPNKKDVKIKGDGPYRWI